MPAPTTHTSAVASAASGSVVNVSAVLRQSDVLFGIAFAEAKKTPYMAGQGGPKTLPVALWQAVGGEAVALAEHLGGGPGCLAATGRTVKEQTKCQRDSLENAAKCARKARSGSAV